MSDLPAGSAVSPPLRPEVAHALRDKVNVVSVALQLVESCDGAARAKALTIARGAVRSLSDVIDAFSGTQRHHRSAERPAPMRTGTRVLIVEDEYLLAQDLSGHLRRAGCEVVGPVGTVEEALGLLLEQNLDCAIVDINLSGELSGRVLTALAARGVPALIVSGYDHAAISDDLKALPFIQKPVDERELVTVVAGLSA